MANDQETQKLLREMHGTMRALDERTTIMLTAFQNYTNSTDTELDKVKDKVSTLEKKHEGFASKVLAYGTVAGVIASTALNKLIF